VGMTGARGGVLGVRREQAVQSMLTKMPVRFQTSEEDPWLMGALVTAGPEPRRATAIEPLLAPAERP
jgi:2',3'-cyclic-nucleotide 2'-phosphodiesterase